MNIPEGRATGQTTKMILAALSEAVNGRRKVCVSSVVRGDLDRTNSMILDVIRSLRIPYKYNESRKIISIMDIRSGEVLSDILIKPVDSVEDFTRGYSDWALYVDPCNKHYYSKDINVILDRVFSMNQSEYPAGGHLKVWRDRPTAIPKPRTIKAKAKDYFSGIIKAASKWPRN